MPEQKVEFWGNLDAALKLLQSVSTAFRTLWNDGVYRMTEEELTKLGISLKTIEAQIKAISVVNDQFKAIVCAKKDQIPEETVTK